MCWELNPLLWAWLRLHSCIPKVSSFLKPVLQSSWLFSQEREIWVEYEKGCLKFGNRLSGLWPGDVHSHTKVVRQNSHPQGAGLGAAATLPTWCVEGAGTTPEAEGERRRGHTPD